MAKYILKKPLPSSESEWSFEAINLHQALHKIACERPLIMRFTLVLPTEKEIHYKKVQSPTRQYREFVKIPHRDFDDYTMDRLGDMIRDIGGASTLQGKLKHEKLSFIDDLDDQVRSWMYNRYLMGYLGDGYTVQESENKMTLIMDGDGSRSGTFSTDKGLVSSFVETQIIIKSLVRKNKRLTVNLEEKVKESEDLKAKIEALENTLRDTQEKLEALNQENISLKSTLTLDTFIPDGLPKQVTEFDRLISAFEGVELPAEEVKIGNDVE